MNHLTDEQIADWLAGEGSAETQRHLADCAACASETAALSGGVRRYALAIQQEARPSAVRSLHKFNVRRELKWLRLRWASAVALGLLLAGTTAYVAVPHEAPTPVETVRTPQPQPAVPAMSDDELLEAVNNDLNRDVPRALAPVGHITAERNRIAAASTGAGAHKTETKQ